MQRIIKNPSIMQEGERDSKGLAMAGQTMDKSITKILLMIFKELKSSDVWNTLQENWKLYQKKQYPRDDNQVEEFREHEEECEASDEDDWQIEMPDEDEIDDIEEACVDEDSPPPKNRQRLSC